MGLPNAFDISYDDWLSIFGEIGQPSYRAGQICGWLWRRGAADPSEMTDFSKALRERLAAMFDFTPPSIEGESRADDGTRKFVLRLSDGEEIETAVLKQGDRITACLSTQVGCPVSCPFCATGAGGFERSMSCGEIASQLVVIEKFLGREANNVVFMGMGEPFLNTDATLGAVRVLNNPKMRGLGIRHMTISTAGVIPGIKALAESGLGVRLAVSLHAASDDLRDELVPCNTSYPLGELIPALREYQTTTGDRITIEYAMFRGKNDSLDHARSLVRLLHGLHSYINIIPANAVTPGYARSLPQDILRFQSVLKAAGFESEIRVERGQDIDAACGQLRRSRDHSVKQTKKKPRP